jgi:hypothetical protein
MADGNAQAEASGSCCRMGTLPRAGLARPWVPGGLETEMGNAELKLLVRGHD